MNIICDCELQDEPTGEICEKCGRLCSEHAISSSDHREETPKPNLRKGLSLEQEIALIKSGFRF